MGRDPAGAPRRRESDAAAAELRTREAEATAWLGSADDAPPDDQVRAQIEAIDRARRGSAGGARTPCRRGRDRPAPPGRGARDAAPGRGAARAGRERAWSSWTRETQRLVRCTAASALDDGGADRASASRRRPRRRGARDRRARRERKPRAATSAPASGPPRQPASAAREEVRAAEARARAAEVASHERAAAARLGSGGAPGGARGHRRRRPPAR